MLKRFDKSLYLGLSIALLFTSIFYPGMMSGDSQGIYNEAINHTYTDHHPPMMAYLWHYLNYIYDGPLSMYLINMALLWSAVLLLSQGIFKNHSFLKYACLFIPFIPQVAVQAGWIYKDLIFSYGYGLLSVYLCYKMINGEKISRVASAIFFVGLLYFTSVKYQAQFVVPILILWFCYVQSNCKFSLRTCLMSVATSIVLISSVHFVNWALVTHKGQGTSNSWQYVKIYDLAGMSVNHHEVLVPEFLLTKKHNALHYIKKTYTLAWEPLIFDDKAVIRVPIDDRERTLLLQAWWKSLVKHPLLYLKHRHHVWSEGLLFASPGKIFLEERLSNHPVLARMILPFADLTALIYLVPFFILSIHVARLSMGDEDLRKYAKAIIFMLSMGVMLSAILFVKSLAGTPRYVYFSAYMLMLSLPFTGHCMRVLLEKKERVASRKSVPAY